jgi:hypothetical protein
MTPKQAVLIAKVRRYIAKHPDWPGWAPFGELTDDELLKVFGGATSEGGAVARVAEAVGRQRWREHLAQHNAENCPECAERTAAKEPRLGQTEEPPMTPKRTYTRSEIRNGTGFKAGQLFVTVEDAQCQRPCCAEPELSSFAATIPGEPNDLEDLGLTHPEWEAGQ